MNLFDITEKDIAELTDADLRELIARLCEAEYRRAGLPTIGVVWGGHQDAPDGGLDIVVLPNGFFPKNSSIPRPSSGFQVKKPAMGASAITKEMKPKGVLRDSIKNLIQENGAYIIVSSGVSVTRTALADRINAMKLAIADEKGHQNFYVDFFDCNRIATWVRDHPGLILWVREKVGRQFSGWRAYGNWANARREPEEEYILDDKLRLYDETSSKIKFMSAEHGLLALRMALCVESASVRLIGLSGVGKTRLAQALFDDRLGKNALNPYQAYYINMSDSPNPDPKTFVERLIASQIRAILIVDNCNPDLHRRLTEICVGLDSTISLLTIEYDIKEDIPEDTAVFRLEPASELLIEKLIRQKFNHISQVDSEAIAIFSGGNARIAIALANTMKKGDTLSGFCDEDLFERLFHQRNSKNDELLKSAEVCALVYSFEGKDTQSEISELKFLASLIDRSILDFYRHIMLIEERDLIQSRGEWKAILPHAIANWLAKRALKFLPVDYIVGAFINSGSERLIKSFSRRLSYLHDSDVAIEIVKGWLSIDGWLGIKQCNFNDFEMTVFENIAPVSPGATLQAIECAVEQSGSDFTSTNNVNKHKFIRILRKLAYDSALFENSVKLLCCFVISENIEENFRPSCDIIKSLFYLHLSGTHAPIEARAAIIELLIYSNDQRKHDLGMLLLDAALEAWQFHSSHDFNFGARSRDFGFRPKTQEEVACWYEKFISICAQIAVSEQFIANKARAILAKNLRGLWTNAKMFDVIMNAAEQIQLHTRWGEGWITVQEIIRYDRSGFNEEIKEKIFRLEQILKPVNLLDRIRTFVLLARHHYMILDGYSDGDVESDLERTEKVIYDLGSEAAQHIDILCSALPELLINDSFRDYQFGRGLAVGNGNKQELWAVLYEQFKKIPSEKRKIRILHGFISSCAENSSEFYHSLLDVLSNDELFLEWVPLFQAAFIDQQGLMRLHDILDTTKLEVSAFYCLAYGGAHKFIKDDDLANLLTKILSKDGGVDVVIEILSMRFDKSEKESHQKYSKKLVKLARDALSTYQFFNASKRHIDLDYSLSKIINVCISRAVGKNTIIKLSRYFIDAIIKHQIYAFDYHQFLNSLVVANPIVFLDLFIANEPIKDFWHESMFLNAIEKSKSSINNIPDSDMLLWCEIDPGKRYPQLLSAIQPFQEEDKSEVVTWKPITKTILEKAPNLDIILEHIGRAIWPTSWSDSLADILEKRSVLFRDLLQDDNLKIRSWAENNLSLLNEQIKNQYSRERSEFNDSTQGFE